MTRRRALSFALGTAVLAAATLTSCAPTQSCPMSISELESATTPASEVAQVGSLFLVGSDSPDDAISRGCRYDVVSADFEGELYLEWAPQGSGVFAVDGGTPVDGSGLGDDPVLVVDPGAATVVDPFEASLLFGDAGLEWKILARISNDVAPEVPVDGAALAAYLESVGFLLMQSTSRPTSW